MLTVDAAGQPAPAMAQLRLRHACELEASTSRLDRLNLWSSVDEHSPARGPKFIFDA